MKVLAGASREVIRFIRGNSRALLRVSAWPLAILAVIIAGQVAAFFMVWRDFTARIAAGDVQADMIAQIVQLQALMFVSQILAAVATAWMFVRVVRLYLNGEQETSAWSKAVWSSVLMSALYGLGISLIAAAAMLGAMICLAIVGVIVALLAGAFGSAPTAAAGAVIGVTIAAAYVGVLALAIWVFCRFAVGLPAVALGRSPDFFRDMWPLSRGETWGLPWRLVVANLVMALVWLPVCLVFAFRVFQTLSLATSDPNATQRVAFEIVSELAWVPAIAYVIAIPLFWFVSLLLAEAYDRFSGRLLKLEHQPGAPSGPVPVARHS